MHGTLVPALWVAVALLSLPEALVLPDANGPVYVAVNVFLLFAILLFLAQAAHNVLPRPLPVALLPPSVLRPLLEPDRSKDNGKDLVTTLKYSIRIEFIHLFMHILCVAYVRTACWFEWRALASAVNAAANTVTVAADVALR